ncbi:dihydrolipoyl dehydrogenase family protein [Mycobacterium sp. SMC-18]|uniref:dihydrolipoyl dehydrogenase family protein n=1 Tax=Mycobacterium TaxID=1763 RepID=UPI000CDE0112|nr:NAD(P)/FAD-dependent oxidoreductase [Mycobacterium kansasii]POX75463.1 pyridine nucleotide-disulfide oxidoreductase [Mycobacterium kansasii]POY13670.1 pyridine nucleotide-disulfide oxidoreductase [Mycobacterium kansasii]
MTQHSEFDVILIGGGPGGASAARYLAAEGLRVALIEERLVGGECHYFACNPTKTLLRPIEVLGLAKAVPGVREAVGHAQLDIAAVFAKRDAIVDHLNDDGVTGALQQGGLAVIHAHGRLTGPRRVTVTHSDGREEMIRARHAVVLATGTRPAIPDIPGLAEARPWTNRDLAAMTHVPPRSLIIGGGVVGVEFATILAGLGSQVTLLARGDTLLRNSETVATEMVTDSLRHKGVDLRFHTHLSRVTRPVAGGVVRATTGDETIEVDEIVIAAGRVVNTDALGLETVGLHAGAFVAVDDHLQAQGVDGEWLYAIGDTTGRALLSHLSQYHAVVVADVIAARAQGRQLGADELIARDSYNLSQVIYTDPQVIEVGRTEEQARADGFSVTTATARYPESVPDLALFRDGFNAWAKLVIDADTNTLLGATFVGPEFAELAQAATLAVVAKVPVEVLRHVVAPHPSINQVWNPLLARQR